jgi:hypothetical protein
MIEYVGGVEPVAASVEDEADTTFSKNASPLK